VSTANHDQLDAAHRDAKAFAEQWAAAHPARDCRPVGPIIRALTQAWLNAFRETGGRHRCSHVTASPMPVFARAHEPGVIRCAPCLEAVAASEPPSAEDYTCDACRWVYPGGIHDAMTVIGPVTLLLGLCTDCTRLEAR
jgi:hypothetical protein